MNIGIIGTNWISKKFAQAVQQTKSATITAVLSRTEKAGNEFLAATKIPGQTHTDLAKFLSTDIEVVYIASPNSLHFEQTMAALQQGKHVIVEKPAFINPKQYALVAEFLDTHPDVMVFEAAKHTYLNTFKNIENNLGLLGDIYGGTLSYMEYATDDPATSTLWSTKYGRGVLYDLGVYAVYDAISWFGAPTSVAYRAHFLPGGADYFGLGTLHFADFDLHIQIGNQNGSDVGSEIYGSKGTLCMNHITHFDQVELMLNDGAWAQHLNLPEAENTMLNEMTAILQAIQHKDMALMQAKFALSRLVGETLFAMRQAAGIEFVDD